MPKWEFAAIVGSDWDGWALRNGDAVETKFAVEFHMSGECEVLVEDVVRSFVSGSQPKATLEIISPLTFRLNYLKKIVDSWDVHPSDINRQLKSMKNDFNQWPERWLSSKTKKSLKKDYGESFESIEVIVSENRLPSIIESDDLLDLINKAGAEGWEITGGIGLADGPPETRWRTMRRELKS